jgi:hypothetical protein
MLRKLRDIIKTYITTKPWFDPSRSIALVSIDSQTAFLKPVDESYASRKTHPAIAGCTVLDLTFVNYGWRLIIDAPMSSITCGIARHLSTQNSLTPGAVRVCDYFGIGCLGLAFTDSRFHSSWHSIAGWNSYYATHPAIVDFRCDLHLGSLNARLNDGPWVCVYDKIPDIGQYSPFIELSLQNTSAAFAPRGSG